MSQAVNRLTSVHILCNLPYGLMDKALVFGAKDCRFESCEDLSLKQESVINVCSSKFSDFNMI